MQKGLKVGLVLALLAICLLLITPNYPWYSVSEELTYEPDHRHWSDNTTESEEIKLYRDYIQNDFYGKGEESDSTEQIDYDSNPDLDSRYDNTRTRSALSSHMETTWHLTLLAALGSAVVFLSAILVAFGVLDRKICAGIAMIGLCLSLLLPVYFFLETPDVFREEDHLFPNKREEGPHESFLGWERVEVLGVEKTTIWRPGIAWFLSVSAVLLNLVAMAGIIGGNADAIKQSKYVNEGYIDRLGFGDSGSNHTTDLPPERNESSYNQTIDNKGNSTGDSVFDTRPHGGGGGSWTDEAPRQDMADRRCPTCGFEVRYVSEIDKWYCDNCESVV